MKVIGCRDSAYQSCIGHIDYRYIEANRFIALWLVDASIYFDFPDRKDRVACYYDFSTYKNVDDRHPGASHKQFISVDKGYYTFETNSTAGRQSTDMWDIPGTKLKRGVFDAERFLIYCLRVSQIIPGTVFRVNDVLISELRTVARKYKLDLTGIRLSENTGTVYNHHTHCHLDIGEVDLKFSTPNFIRLQ